MLAASKTARGVYVAPVPTDPYFPNVVLLLETDSTNGKQNNTFLDSSANNFTITRAGTQTQGSVTPYRNFGYWSNNFSGTGVTASIPALRSGPSLYFYIGSLFAGTIECWVYLTSYNTAALPGGASTIWCLNNGTPKYIALTISSTGYLSISADSGAGAISLASTTIIPLRTWTHIAWTYTTSASLWFVNGADITSQFSSNPTLSGNWPISGGSPAITIGATYYGNATYTYLYGLAGFISNFRITFNTTRYTSAFTPPTSPFVYDANTSLLTCQSPSFIETSYSTANFVIATNPAGSTGPSIQAFNPFPPPASYTTAYGGSGYFNGASRLTVATSTAFGFGTGDFTIEFWVYFTNGAAVQEFIDARSADTAQPWVIGATTTGLARSYDGATIRTGGQLVSNAWSHVAWVRASNVNTVYVNGVSGHTWTATQDFGSTKPLSLGNNVGPTNEPLTGWLSNIRIVKGVPVYTGTFLPPTLLPLTTSGSTSASCYPSTTNINTTFASSSTSFLANFTNAGIYDATMQNNELTAGAAQASTTVAKWSPTSISFNGTTSYLQSAFRPQYQFGVSNFTIEFWVYFNSVAINQRIAGQDNNSTTLSWAIFTTAAGTLNYYLSSTGNTWNIATGVSMGSIAINNWYYVALTRNGSVFTPYINSTAGTTTTNAAALFASTSPLTIGATLTAVNYFNGYIQDFRITNGVARTITTPTAAFLTR